MTKLHQLNPSAVEHLLDYLAVWVVVSIDECTYVGECVCDDLGAVVAGQAGDVYLDNVLASALEARDGIYFCVDDRALPQLRARGI